MTNAALNHYITTHYDEWVQYARMIVGFSHLPIDHNEVVNDALLRIIEKGVAMPDDTEELNFYIKRIIKISIISPRSQFRYSRGQHCTQRMDERDNLIPYSDDDGFDYNDAYEKVVNEFHSLELSEFSRRVFAWRIIDGKPFSEWEGNEAQKTLYEVFNRVKLIISARLRKKYSD